MKKKYLFFVSALFIMSLLNKNHAQENKGKISGYMFGDYFYNIVRDTGILNLPEQFSFIGRYDYLDPASESGSDLRNLLLFGSIFQPDEKICITPNILIETYENLSGGTKVDPSITGRLTFFFIISDVYQARIQKQ